MGELQAGEIVKPKSAAQRVIDYFCGHPMGCDTVTIIKDLRREDKERRQMERAIVKYHKCGGYEGLYKIAERLAKRKERHG